MKSSLKLIFMMLGLAMIVRIPSSSAASSSPGNDTYSHSHSKSISVEIEEKRDVAKILYQADAVFVGVMGKIYLHQGGMGPVPIQAVQISFKNLKVLKGPDLNQRVFRYTQNMESLERYQRLSKVLAALKKDGKSGYVIEHLFQATEKNLSLVP